MNKTCSWCKTPFQLFVSISFHCQTPRGVINKQEQWLLTSPPNISLGRCVPLPGIQRGMVPELRNISVARWPRKSGRSSKERETIVNGLEAAWSGRVIFGDEPYRMGRDEAVKLFSIHKQIRVTKLSWPATLGNPLLGCLIWKQISERAEYKKWKAFRFYPVYPHGTQVFIYKRSLYFFLLLFQHSSVMSPLYGCVFTLNFNIVHVSVTCTGLSLLAMVFP